MLSFQLDVGGGIVLSDSGMRDLNSNRTFCKFKRRDRGKDSESGGMVG